MSLNPDSALLWVTRLSEVGAPILKKREAVIERLRQVEELNKQAAELRAQADLMAVQLEIHINASGLWTREEVHTAKRS